MANLDALVQEKLDGDQAFQASIAAMSDTDKQAAITAKRSEILEAEFAALGEKAKKNEEIAGNYKTRAERAEGEVKTLKGSVIHPAPQPQPQDTGLSTTDLYALMGAKVPQEDVSVVQEAAKILGQSITDVLKNPVLQGRLAQLSEQRASAAAANTGAARAGTKAPTDAEILAEASKGNIPKPGTPEATDLFWARRGGKRSR